jgi:hypothetical protein
MGYSEKNKMGDLFLVEAVGGARVLMILTILAIFDSNVG